MRVSIPVALSALPRPALFACGSLLTVTEPRPYHSLDPRPHRIGPRLPGQHGPSKWSAAPAATCS